MHEKIHIYQQKNANSLKWVFYLTFIFTMLGFISDTPRSLANNEIVSACLNAGHIVFSLLLLPFVIFRKVRIYHASLLIIYGELLVVILNSLYFIFLDQFTLGLLSVASVLGVLYIGLISLLTAPLHTLIYGITISSFVLITSLFYRFEASFVFPPVYALILYSFTLGMYLFTNKMLHAFYKSHKHNEKLKEIDDQKNKFFADISHDFRTPLTVINGIADKIKTEPDIGKVQLKQEAEMIARNGRHLLHLVNQMLDLARIDRMNLKLHYVQADIIPYLQYIFECFKSIAENRQIHYYIYKETDTLVMDFDPGHLYKIASNLLSNALKFSGKNATIVFHIHYDSRDNQLILKVSDTGTGIPPDKLPRIFERFYTVSLTKKSKGTGIGLALAKELTELMQGSIDVKSSREGTVFTVHLPVLQQAERADSIEKPDPFLPGTEFLREDFPQETRVNQKAPNKLIVLLIEDNADVARFIESCIANHYQTMKAADGRRGVHKAFEVIPDLIIADVMMPQMDGFEVCRNLKNDERTSHIPFIFLTARASDADKVRGIAGGADAYLVKPFNKAELLVRMEQLIELRKKLRLKYQNYIDNPWPTNTPDHSFLQKALAAIEQELHNSDFKASDLAFALNLSDSQVYRKIKALTGKSTAVFIRSVRLHHAREKLKASRMNIAETAYACGFNDPSWFSRIFKEEFGYAPSALKRQ